MPNADEPVNQVAAVFERLEDGGCLLAGLVGDRGDAIYQGDACHEDYPGLRYAG